MSGRVRDPQGAKRGPEKARRWDHALHLAFRRRRERTGLNPGDVIEEARLMDAHGVSRTPVREAFIQLEASGLIRRLPRKGAVLFKPTLEEFLAILEVHAKLEGQAAGLAARRSRGRTAATCRRYRDGRWSAEPHGL